MELLDNETEGAADAGAAELAPGDTQVAASGNGGIQRDVEAEAGRAVAAAARQRRLGISDARYVVQCGPGSGGVPRRAV